ncbi:SDR family oxidoreductase [Rugosimonospora acidiphila]|uniref:SDR family oxidoreductase n=1 Tax=Rugosimonospora acidiphila TaxID=556531 RepID=A0ABP9SNR1_9ACTN
MYSPTTSLPDEFAGRRALVTGGSRGIGAAVARRLIEAGAAVVTSARTATEDTPKESTFIAADLRSEAGARQLAERAVETLGGLDILVNAAGAARVHLAGPASIPDAEWQDSLDINFLSAVRLTNAALPALQESGNGAAIVNISTGVAKNPQAPVLHYAAAKAALATYSKGLANALAPAGIRVNVVTLGPVETPGGTEIMQTIADAMGAPLAAMASGIPLGRFGDPREVAEAVAFLASTRAQWITAADLDINGGQ